MSRRVRRDSSRKHTLEVGDRVMIIGLHPWSTSFGTLMAYERFGLGWFGWRVKLDTGQQCYVTQENLKWI